MKGRRRKERQGQAPPARSEAPARDPVMWGALVLFAVALGIRLLFWRSGPDSAWPYSAFFKGDALVWIDYARSLQGGVPFELGLPIHPPGTGYLVSWLWGGSESGTALLRLAACVLGAAAVMLFSLAIARSFGTRVAGFAAAWMAASTGLLALSSSLNAEAPYLVIVAASFALLEDLLPRPRPGRLVAWSVLSGLACLFRVEHVLFFAPLLALLGTVWWRSTRSLGPIAVALLSFAAPLVPWHARAWSGIARFNEVEPTSDPTRRLESPPGLSWDAAALARRAELPAFARSKASAFVALTVLHRGGQRVAPADFGILEEAFGSVPRPMARFPFVSSYGAINFALANNARAGGGFSPALLEDPPALLGGPSRYPLPLVAGLPPPQLELTYPPHLRLFNEGYSIGRDWILRNPGPFARLAAAKLRIFWSGAALGFTGYGLPLGASGTRRAVDLATPDDKPSATAWRLVILVACVAGCVAGLPRPALWPWLVFLASKVAATVLFFGYARMGAAVVPVVALLSALAAERWLVRRLPRAGRRGVVAAALAAAALVGVEAARCLQAPRVFVDGREVGPRDPFTADVHRDQRVEVR